MLIALVASADPTTCSLSDANGNAWVFVSNSEADRSLGSGIWKSYAKLGGGQLVTTTGDTLTVSCGGSSFAEADLIAIKGNLAGSDPQDQSSYYAGSANLGTSQPGSITPVSNTLVLTQGCNLFGSGFAITGGYTIQDTDGSDHYCAFAILTPSAGATNPTWTFTVGFHATSEIVSVK
jgi:hypothetical protein